MQIKRSIVDTGTVKLFCLDSIINNITIICLHGRWGRAETWMDFIKQYENKYRVIAPDQRGHGLSDKPKSTYSVEEMANDVVDLASALNIEKFILVGHSMGGGIAANVAAMYPDLVYGLAILDKSPCGPIKKQNLRPEDVNVYDPITNKWPMPFNSRSEAISWISKEMKSELSREYFENSLYESVDGINMMYSNYAIAANIANYHEWYDILQNIYCPTLIIRSNSHEAVNDSDYNIMKRDIQNSIAFEISDPDHNVHLGNKKEFYSYFDIFLEVVHKGIIDT